MAVRESGPAGGRASSSTCRGIRSPASSATSASTRRSTSTNREVVDVQEHVVAVPRLQRVHEGQGPARRALHHQPHLRHLRRQPRRLLVLRAADGLRRQAAAAGRVDRQPRRGRRVHLRPHHLPGQPGVRGLLRADGARRRTRACWAKAEKTEAPRRRASTATARSRDIMRSYNPFTGETYREALHMSRDRARDDLPDGGAPRAPVDDLPGRRRARCRRRTLFTDYLVRLLRCLDFIKKAVAMNDDVFDFFYEALPGYEEVGRRRILLGCWGAFNNPDHVDYTLREHGRLGQRDVRHPGRGRRRRAGHDEPRRHQPRHPHPARQLLLRGLGERGDVRRAAIRSATRSTSATRGTRRRSPSRRSATSRAATTRWVMSPRWFDKRTGDHLALDTGGGALARLWATALANKVEHAVRERDRPQRA